MRAFRVIGTTDDCTTCDLCHREDLKYTVALMILDAEGNDVEPVYYGSDCARKAAGWTQKELSAKLREAKERAWEERERAWREASARDDAAMIAWAEAKYGITAENRSKLFDNLTAAIKDDQGRRRSPISFVKEYSTDKAAA